MCEDGNGSTDYGVCYVNFTVCGQTGDFWRDISAFDGGFIFDGAAFAGLSAAKSAARIPGPGEGWAEKASVYHGGSGIYLWYGIRLCSRRAERGPTDLSDLSDIRRNPFHLKQNSENQSQRSCLRRSGACGFTGTFLRTQRILGLIDSAGRILGVSGNEAAYTVAASSGNHNTSHIPGAGPANILNSKKYQHEISQPDNHCSHLHPQT